MTDNQTALPKVGARYREKSSGTVILIIALYLRKGFEALGAEIEIEGKTLSCLIGEDFFNHYEELPEEPSHFNDVVKMGQPTENAVEKAKEDLKTEVKKVYQFLKSEGRKYPDMLDLNLSLITFAAEKLVNALEEEKKNITVKVAPDVTSEQKTCQNHSNSVKPIKSKVENIWKPVSELPKKIEHLLIKWNDGEILLGKYNPHEDFTHEGWKGCWYNLSESKEEALNHLEISQWVSLTDFITSFTELEERVERIEELLCKFGLPSITPMATQQFLKK